MAYKDPTPYNKYTTFDFNEDFVREYLQELSLQYYPPLKHVQEINKMLHPLLPHYSFTKGKGNTPDDEDVFLNPTPNPTTRTGSSELICANSAYMQQLNKELEAQYRTHTQPDNQMITGAVNSLSLGLQEPWNNAAATDGSRSQDMTNSSARQQEINLRFEMASPGEIAFIQQATIRLMESARSQGYRMPNCPMTVLRIPTRQTNTARTQNGPEKCMGGAGQEAQQSDTSNSQTSLLALVAESGVEAAIQDARNGIFHMLCDCGGHVIRSRVEDALNPIAAHNDPLSTGTQMVADIYGIRNPITTGTHMTLHATQTALPVTTYRFWETENDMEQRIQFRIPRVLPPIVSIGLASAQYVPPDTAYYSIQLDVNNPKSMGPTLRQIDRDLDWVNEYLHDLALENRGEKTTGHDLRDFGDELVEQSQRSASHSDYGSEGSVNHYEV